MQSVKLLIKYNVDVNVVDNVSLILKFSWFLNLVDLEKYPILFTPYFNRKDGLHCILPYKVEIET